MKKNEKEQIENYIELHSQEKFSLVLKSYLQGNLQKQLKCVSIYVDISFPMIEFYVDGDNGIDFIIRMYEKEMVYAQIFQNDFKGAFSKRDFETIIEGQNYCSLEYPDFSSESEIAPYIINLIQQYITYKEGFLDKNPVVGWSLIIFFIVLEIWVIVRRVTEMDYVWEVIIFLLLLFTFNYIHLKKR